MITFLLSVAALILGYLLYGRFVEKVFYPHPDRVTPAVRNNDGVDFIPMPSWKVFMIQFLNIAGTGPIFGAIMGAKFGPSCYLWIVFGCIFAGAVHDYVSGMLSLKYNGGSLMGLFEHYYGKIGKVVMMSLLIILLILVGAVFVYSPALILGKVTTFFSTPHEGMMFWVLVIVGYYLIATLLPIDKVIGKIYPLFAVSMLFMAVALLVCLLVKWPSIPEIWDGLQNRGPSVGVEGQPIFPYLFVTVACGAISGFHATQSPMMARCMKNELNGRPVFFGSMITEGLVALIWAAVSSYFFFDGGMAEVGASSGQAPEVVTSVARSWLGVVGGILAILGVVAAPITTGDTALRSARLMVAEIFNIDQKPIFKRLLVCIPIFGASAFFLWLNITDENGFNNIWKYFGWFNQTLACITLWTVTLWMVRHRIGFRYMITLVPAFFMTHVCVLYILFNKIGFGLPLNLMPWAAAICFICCLILTALMLKKHKGVSVVPDEIV